MVLIFQTKIQGNVVKPFCSTGVLERNINSNKISSSIKYQIYIVHKVQVLLLWIKCFHLLPLVVIVAVHAAAFYFYFVREALQEGGGTKAVIGCVKDYVPPTM